MISSINSIGVCGAGTMGSGIAQVAAQAGFHVVLYDLDQATLGKARTALATTLQALESKGRLPPGQADLIQSRIRFTNDINDCVTDLVVEAIVEKVAPKIALFNRLAELNHSETIFATNTSSLSVSTIARGIVHPARVVGMHFFNPAPVMKLVEVVQGELTAPEIVDTVLELARELGKTPVRCMDRPGFIVNRVARPYYLEALRLATSQGIAPGIIDQAMRSVGFRMGPFELMDLIGNDVNLAVTKSLYEALGRPPRLAPSPLQERKVAEGHLGRKTSRGYYDYEAKS